MDYGQKHGCVKIIRVNINYISYLRACRSFRSNELDIGIVFCDVKIAFLDNSGIV